MSKTWMKLSAVALLCVCGAINGLASECKALTKADKDTEAFPFCLIDAEHGDAYAQNVVGVSYNTGHGVGKDTQKAISWYRKSAAQGFAKAEFNMGLSYLSGELGQKDEAQAIIWWRKAAAQGEAQAQYNLGVGYTLGNVVKQDGDVAAQWYYQAGLSFLKDGMKFHAMDCKDSIKSLAGLHIRAENAHLADTLMALIVAQK